MRKNVDEQNSGVAAEGQTFLLKDLCLLADLPVRTVRYYIQIGLVDRPDGDTRAARYGAKHLEQLLTIRKWTAAGLSLERIRDLLHGEAPPVSGRPKARGSVEVKSHLTIADGLELVVEPEAAGVTPEQLRRLLREIAATYDRIVETDETNEEEK
jgi:DNA-binding transcriptional MerR regulator